MKQEEVQTTLNELMMLIPGIADVIVYAAVDNEVLRVYLTVPPMSLQLPTEIPGHLIAVKLVGPVSRPSALSHYNL